MFNRHLISGLLVGVALLAATTSVQACAYPCADSCGGQAFDCAPTFRTITVTEWVPETYESTRTVYKTQYVTETYTAFKSVCVPETRVVPRTIVRTVPVWTEQCRTVFKCVPSCETRTVVKKVVVCVPVTTVRRKCVERGHWECCTVERGPSLCDRLHKCCDPCYEPCPRCKTKKVWVSCPVWVEIPCTKMVRHVECVPETIQVTVNRMVPVQETFKVCTHRCITECVNETVTVMVRKCVPVPATRCVATCVPVCEKVLCTRLVPHTVCKQVPCEPCEPCCKKKRGLFGR